MVNLFEEYTPNKYNTPAVKSSAGAPHDHPACKTSGGHKHEKAYVESTIEGESTEGCIDHYAERIVSEDENFQISTDDHDTSDLAKYIVMGEILNNPRFRNRR